MTLATSLIVSKKPPPTKLSFLILVVSLTSVSAKSLEELIAGDLIIPKDVLVVLVRGFLLIASTTAGLSYSSILGALIAPALPLPPIILLIREPVFVLPADVF